MTKPPPGVCTICLQRMLDVDGCEETSLPFLIDGEPKRLDAVLYGDEREGWAESGITPPDRCHDCNCAVGHAHHNACDMARCPNCRQQFLGCSCEMLEPNDPRLLDDDDGSE